MISVSSRLRLLTLAVCCALPVAACDSPAPPAPSEGTAPAKVDPKTEVHTLPPIKN
jgi:hypothetical protein